MTKQLVTAERCRELLNYEKETGVFLWIDGANQKNKIKGVAGRTTPEGYRTIQVDRRNYLSHRLAWLYVYGEWPHGFIDHINRNKADNRISNLRVVTKSENCENVGLSKKNTSGFKGVSWNKDIGKWNAKIGHRRRRINLGYFSDLTEAANAYIKAASELHRYNPVAGVAL